MKINLFISVVLVIFVGMGISFACHNKEEVEGITVPILIPEEVARNVAQNFLNIRASLPQGGMPEWKGAGLSTPVIYYSPTGEPAAYCFRVIKDGKDLGYILISADKTHFPVQEFSRSPAPHKRALPACKRIARAKLKEGQRLGEPTIVSPSLGTYFVVLPVLEGEKKVDKMVFCSRGLFFLPKEILKLRSDLPTKEMVKRAKESWERLKKEDLRPHKYAFRYLPNMPAYPFLLSCHPTITAALLDYWGLREKDESKKEFIAEVARHIREEREGMIVYNIPGRIEHIVRARGYSLKIAIRGRASFNPEEVITFAGYKKEINKGHPPILIFPFGLGAGKDLSTALAQMVQFPSIGVGYSSDPTGNFVIVSESLFAHESEEDIVQGEFPWARTGVTFYNWRGRAGNLLVISISEPEKE